MPKGKPSKAAKPALPKEPRLRCPITGEEFRFAEVHGKWIAMTSLYTTRMYEFKDTLLYMLSHTDGKAPNYPMPGIEVIRYENEPPGDKEYVGPAY